MKKIIITEENRDEIIARQIDGIAGLDEINAIAAWRRKSDDNEKYYQHLIQTDGLFSNMKSHPIDVDVAWKAVSSKMHGRARENRNQMSSDSRPKRHIFRVVGLAASLLVLFSTVFLLKNSNSTSKLITDETAMVFDLDDGSVIKLGKNSGLNKLSKEGREYNFSGEAEFHIIHDDERPFVVHMKDVIVKDLGTVFNIRSIPAHDTVFVKVTEGSAQFYTISDSGIILEEGEEGMYIKSKNKFYKRSSDKKNQFLSITFENAQLSEVIDHLAYSFRKNISVRNESLRKCNLTVDFTKAPLSVVKEIIEETLNVDIEEDHTSLSIVGEGCE